METTVIEVTPTVAKQWLEANTINRPLRPSVIQGLKAAFERGEYRLTHQGIAFAVNGELLDGQHRLTAIAEMPAGFKIKMMVTKGLPADSFKGIDQGLKRTPSDVLSISSGHAAVARSMAVIYETSRAGITAQFLIPFVRGCADAYNDLVSFCPKNTKVWSSASIRTAAILQLLNAGDADYIKVTYYALNHAEFDSMSPSAQTLYRQQVSGQATTRTYDMFCRAMKVFDSKQSNLSKIQIADPSTMIGIAREIITSKVLGRFALPAQKKGSYRVPKETKNA